MAHKKGGGSTTSGRDSKAKRLGIKKYAGEKVLAGTILVRQKGTKIHPGNNIGVGGDYTLYATINGTVHYEPTTKNKKKVSIIAE